MHLALNAWFWDSPTTGSGQYTRRLVEGLADLAPGLQISLIVSPREGQNEEAAASALPGSCSLHSVPGDRSNLGKVWFEQIAFPRACARIDAEVAHVPYWAPPVRSSLPTVVTIHDLIPLVLRRYRGGPLQRLYTALVSAAARGATLVLTDSEASRRDILSRLALSHRSVRTVPLAADGRFDPEPTSRDAAIRAAYGLPGQYVLYLGGFDWRKNLATLFAAYREAAPAIAEECPLVIAGQLPKEDTLLTPHPRRLMQEHPRLEGSVHFSGFVEERDKPALYRGAVAFVFPSRYEGFGLPPLEALACGTPVVASNAASLPEIVGDAGILLPPDDAAGMAGALIQLAVDERFRAEMSSRALAQAAKFSWQRTAAATLTAYEDARRRGASENA